MVIVIGGRIGLGKTTTSKIISDERHIPVYYESVEDNKILPLFYSATEYEIARKALIYRYKNRKM